MKTRNRGRWLVAAALIMPLRAEIVCALGSAASSYKADSDQRPSSDALQLANRVNAAVKTLCGAQCPTMALFRNPTAANAMLIVDSSQAKLVYAPQFLAAAYDSFGDGGIIALIAHEVGHALDETLGAAWIKKTWTAEVRADAWAGCLLARLDPAPASLQPSLAALAKYSSPAHPAWTVRLPALRTGYTQCGGSASKFDSPSRTPAKK